MTINKECYSNFKLLIGSNIKNIRNRRDMRQVDLGAKVGLSAATISNIESGRAWPSCHEKKFIANALDVPLELLYIPDKDGSVESTVKHIYHSCHTGKDLDEALKMAHDLLASWSHNQKIIRGVILNIVGKVHLSRAEYDQAFDSFYTMLLEVGNTNDNTLMYASLYNISLTKFYMKEYEQGLEYAIKAEKYVSRPRQNDKTVQKEIDLDKVGLLNLQALMHVQLKNADESIKILKEIIPIYKDNGLHFEELQCTHNLGYAFYLKGLKGKALEIYEEVYDKLKEYKFADKIAIASKDIANSYIELGNFDKAEKILEEAITFRPFYPSKECEVLHLLAQCKKDVSEKITILEEALSIAEGAKYYNMIRKIAVELGDLYEGSDVVAAMKYYKTALKAGDLLLK